MQYIGLPAGLCRANSKGVNQLQAEKILVKTPCFLGVTASVSRMVQSLYVSHYC
jgi:hypothetical protein